MRQVILDYLNKKQDFEILMAVESGSRAAGIASKDSDYDIRYVYYYPVSEYLKLFNSRKDTVDEFVELKKAELDYTGWDLFKFLRLIAKSNPSALEWLRSPHIYIDSPYREELLEITSNFSRFSLFKHYVSLSRNNYDKYLVERIDPTLKKYLYVLRGQLNAIYIYLTHQFPPIDIEELLEELRDLEDKKEWDLKMIIHSLREMVQIKKSGHEYDVFKAPPEVNFWIAETFDQLDLVSNELETIDKKYGIDKEKLETLLDEILQTKR